MGGEDRGSDRATLIASERARERESERARDRDRDKTNAHAGRTGGCVAQNAGRRERERWVGESGGDRSMAMMRLLCCRSSARLSSIDSTRADLRFPRARKTSAQRATEGHGRGRV
eukprot:155211-Rhodomonas_salina.1